MVASRITSRAPATTLINCRGDRFRCEEKFVQKCAPTSRKRELSPSNTFPPDFFLLGPQSSHDGSWTNSYKNRPSVAVQIKSDKATFKSPRCALIWNRWSLRSAQRPTCHVAKILRAVTWTYIVCKMTSIESNIHICLFAAYKVNTRFTERTCQMNFNGKSETTLFYKN